MKKLKKVKTEIGFDEYIKANRKVSREIELEQNGGRWVAKDRPHKNKKAYDRKRDKKINFDLSLFFLHNIYNKIIKYMKKNTLKKTIKNILNEEINKIINESFNSSIIQKLYNRHGGIDKSANFNAKYVLSNITDDMIGDLYSSKEECKGNLYIPFGDGSVVSLKKPNSEEGMKLFNQLFGNNGNMYKNKWNSQYKRRNDSSFYDTNYQPEGVRGEDYYSIMKNAKSNGYRISNNDKDPNKSVYLAGSNLNRYYDNTMINSKRKSFSNKDNIINNAKNREKWLKQRGDNPEKYKGWN